MPRDDRTYITVHDGLPDHPKIEALSDAAFRLLVEAWCWCSRNRTDGRIVGTSWRKRGTPKARAELLTAGLIETVEDGVLMHDYTEHQRTAAEIDAIKEKRRAAGSKGGKAKANAVASASPVAKQTASKDVAETETETETEKNLAARPPSEVTPIRPRDEIFDAVVSVCGIDPKAITTAGRGPINTAVKQLRSVEATPAQITLRARNYRQQYRDATLTPTALAKHWAQLGNDHRPPEGHRPQDTYAALSRRSQQ